MTCQITALCIGCYNCLEVCPRGAIVEEAGHFAIRVKRCNECRENKPGPRVNSSVRWRGLYARW